MESGLMGMSNEFVSITLTFPNCPVFLKQFK
jgi:hypothetical protein